MPQSGSQAMAVLIPVSALLAPIAISVYIVQKAQRVIEADRAALWFSCVRFLRWLVIGTFLGWWVATDLVHWKPNYDVFLKLHAISTVPAGRLLSLIFFWLPPMIVVVLCQILLRPVYSGVRGIVWTRAELAGQMICTLGATFVPLLLVISGSSQMNVDGDLRSFLVPFVIAVVSMIFFGRRLRKLMQLSPSALTTGELRDRAFFLAAQLRVKLQQIYLLPPSRSRLANAYARSGRSILLTHYLLSHLTRREVDTVVAHELAHIKHDHPRLLGFALLGGLAAVAVPYFSTPWPVEWKPLFDVLFIVVPLLTYYFVARRFEFTADATSVRTTGDPQAMITSLVKLHRLNLMPLQWGKWNEKLLTHPSTVRRAQAIAGLANLSSERVSELLEESKQQPAAKQDVSSDDLSQYYSLPSPESLKQKIFSTEFKQSIASRSQLCLFAIIVILPPLLLRGLNAAGIFTSTFPVFAATFLLAAGVLALFLNFAPFLSAQRLQRKMQARAEAEALVPRDALLRGDAVLVGLSPGPAPRIFEGNYSWDAGYLYLEGDRLCYCGEETRFSLRRDQIVTAQLGPGIPGWFRAKSLYIVWRDSQTGSSAIFNVRPLAVRSVLAMNRGVKALTERIERWREPDCTSPMSIGQNAELPQPEVRAVTGTSIAESTKPQQLYGLFVLMAVMSAITAYLFGMPFEDFFAVFLIVPGATASSAGVSGWQAILCSSILTLLVIVPLLRARNSSVSLAADPSPNPAPPPRPVTPV